MSRPTTPPDASTGWFGLLPVRSPLLGKSLLFRIPLPTEMFQFGRFAFPKEYHARGVVGFPIRTPVDQRFFAAPHGFSQLSTSFIAIACLGIHRTPLLTCPCMACTIAVHAIQAMSSILCYLAFYHTIHLRRAPRGPAHPLLSNMSKNIPLLRRGDGGQAPCKRPVEDSGASIPCPAHI